MSVNQNKKTKKWYFRCKYRDSFGVEKYKYKTGFNSKCEAIDNESDFFKLIRMGADGKIKIDELSALYLEHKKKTLRPIIYGCYEHIIADIINPYWKSANMNNINMKMIIQWQQYLLELKYDNQGVKTLCSNSQLDRIQGVLASVLNYGALNCYTTKKPREWT